MPGKACSWRLISSDTRDTKVDIMTAINDFSENQIKSIVDIVDAPSSAGEFPGFNPDPTLPSSPLVQLGDREHLVVHSVWGLRTTILLISIKDGSVKNLTPLEDNLPYSWMPFEVVLGEFDDQGNVSWRVLQESLSLLPQSVQDGLRALKVGIITIPDRHPTESILVQQSKLEEGHIPPHILIPHGGPHATSVVRFDVTVAGFALEGYNVSVPNYTGSLGFGETHVRALIGNCSTLDVGDCIASVRHMVKLGVAEEAPSKLFMVGGSHGGFLTGHLIGQYPDTFTAASLCNPVMSCGEVSTSDIRDWFWAEFGRDYPIQSSEVGSDGCSIPVVKSVGVMTPELYGVLFKASPIAYVEKVKAAVLLCIGGSDKCVAPTQGIDYYHALKAARAKGKNGLKSDNDDGVEMLWFQEDEAFTTVAPGDFFIHRLAIWILKIH
ncbi:acylamino-acid-releasing enzyme [Moniliophthora roreri MCA 2997]|uniref:acylaminoacyl-peptidase n=1 Tax=Moniliophthora roreri (strain MCA 2997) TaxID=1381753 RepID=V2WPI9_MONRO|nr:acylamino-acid-releasing enzyme [Moniliophthora roreri MCA 2997]